MNTMEERMHGDLEEHKHDGYEYWHPASRMHTYGTPLPECHVPNRTPDPEVSLEDQEREAIAECYRHPIGLQVQPFDWKKWDAGCEAKGICQGYASIPVLSEELEAANPFALIEHDVLLPHYTPQYPATELHHRKVSPDLIGIVEAYWQCPHCKQLQKPIQWIQGARLETYWVEVRGSRTVIWVKVSSGAWFVLIIRAYGSLQGVARGICDGTVYFCGIPGTSDAPPLQLPDECSTILARRMWHRLTKGYWSDRKKEDDDC